MAWLIKHKRKNPETGRKATYYRIGWLDEKGRTRTRTIGFLPPVEAERLLQQFEARQRAGLPLEPPQPSEPSSTAKQTPRLREFLDEVWLPVAKRDYAPKTYTSARTAASALKSTMGLKYLDEIDFKLIDAHITRRKKSGRRARTVQLDLWALKKALGYAVDAGVLSALPTFPKVVITDARPHRFLTDAESTRLLDALKPLDVQPHEVTRGAPPINRGRLSYLAVLMALNTGMRKRELLTRGWEDVRWEMGARGAILVDSKPQIGFTVKTRRSKRAIPLTPELAAALQEEHARVGHPEKGWIFPGRRDPKKPRVSFRTALNRACKRAGIEHIHPHGLRHTWASRLAMAGVDRRTLMELGGWSVGQMLDGIYAHVTDSHKDDVMGRMGITDNRSEEPTDEE
jgi:integrase